MKLPSTSLRMESQKAAQKSFHNVSTDKTAIQSFNITGFFFCMQICYSNALKSFKVGKLYHQFVFLSLFYSLTEQFHYGKIELSRFSLMNCQKKNEIFSKCFHPSKVKYSCLAHKQRMPFNFLETGKKSGRQTGKKFEVNMKA